MAETIDLATFSETSHKPMSSSQLAEMFGVSRKTISQWGNKVKDAYHWLDETAFTVGKGNKLQYTPFSIEQMRALQTAENQDQWIASIRAKQPANEPHREISETVKGQLALMPRSTMQSSIVTSVSAIVPELVTADIALTQQATQATAINLNNSVAAIGAAFILNNQAQFKVIGAVAANAAVNAMSQGMLEQLQSAMQNPQAMQQQISEIITASQQQQ